MKEKVEIEYRHIEENEKWNNLIEKVINECYDIEDMNDYNLYISVILTTPQEIHELNSKYRDVDKETDVLSFPMFEKTEIKDLVSLTNPEPLGDIVISIDRVREQAEEYGHSFERELSYMLVHGFYHLMGEDHIDEEDKIIMRAKEEKVLSRLGITRDR